jgi:glycolate oxidase iron-sulfur subunit
MKNVLESSLAVEEAQPYVDRCLGCLACVTACPSGVPYGDLLVGYRGMTEKDRKRPLMDTLARTMVCETLPYPDRFRLAAATGKIGKAIKPLLPDTFATMLDLLPDELPESKSLPEFLPAQGEKRGKVLLLLGCVQQVLASEIAYCAAHVLSANGVDVVIPKAQGCCGSILSHVGEMDKAISVAQQNFDLVPDDIDAIITTAAGCGSGIDEYELLFKGHPEQDRATAFAHKTMDVSAYLAKIGLRDPKPLAQEMVVAYQDACHLYHAQGIYDEPRDLLEQIPNVTLVDIPDAGMCCGSAGTYNIDQPEIAHQLGQNKVNNVLSVAPDVVVSGNIGCMTQMRVHMDGKEKAVPVMHIVQLLMMAY